MIQRLLPAQRRSTFECAGIAVLTLLWQGVEDSAQFLALRRMGCDVGQGYYFGRPMDAGDMDRLVGDELTVARTVTPAS